MRLLVIFFFIIITSSLKAHDPSHATFYIYQDDQRWNVRADFAWSVRNALINKYPFLKDSGTTDQQFVDCMMEYIEDNMSIKIDHQQLEFKSIYQVPGAHTHSYVFVLALDGVLEGSQMSITNTCMFDFYKKQKNTIFIENRQQCILEKKEDACQVEI